MARPWVNTEREETPVSDDIERRVKRLLDQLERPNLPDHEVEAIKEKIEFLRGLQS